MTGTRGTGVRCARIRDGDAEGGLPRPWLLGIATNVARNIRRAGRRHAAAVARLLGSGVFEHGDEGDTDFDFDFGLDRVLDGIEVLVESRR
ncbi:hypothetical protein [Streptomyces sp. NBC_01314]|uniref:hypothetical protein n=1 Tax=Streptomyces sp. NBC_01314 TaxID=2903821 RepID=UPI00352D73CA